MVFDTLNTKTIAEEIDHAEHRVIYMAPGLVQPIADSIIEATKRVGFFSVVIILDCEEKPIRSGYGSIEAIQSMQEAGIKIRHHHGLRIGLLICDDRAWSFTPVPLCIEEEPIGNTAPNAIRLLAEQAEVLASEICPEELITDKVDVARGIGKEIVRESDVNFITSQLEIAPPLQFNIFRQVQVFLPYMQYVDLSLKGCSINRRSVRITPEILRLVPDEEIESRFRTTFNLIERNSELSDEALQRELKRIKEIYVRSLGKPWRNVLLRTKRKEFDKEIVGFKQKLEKHQEQVKSTLQKEIDNSIEKIVEAFAERIKIDPPRRLIGQISGEKPNRQEAENWLRAELKKTFPEADKLITRMELTCFFRDVTYETLKNEGFEKALKKAFPAVNWDKPFTEFQAAEARSADQD